MVHRTSLRGGGDAHHAIPAAAVTHRVAGIDLVQKNSYHLYTILNEQKVTNSGTYKFIQWNTHNGIANQMSVCNLKYIVHF